MNLELTIRAGRLVVTIVNPTPRERRLWEWHNSWGWYALTVEARDDAGTSVEIMRKPRDWSKNGPTMFELPPNERREAVLDLHDGSWEIAPASSAGSDLARLQDRRVELRARLEIQPTPESEQLGVFTGTVFSEWIVSTPPHDWLPRR